MKKLMIAVVGASLVAVANVKAGLIPIEVSYVPGYHYGNGGELNVSPVIGGPYASSVVVNGGYETFCVDLDLGITAGGPYYAEEGNGSDIALGTAYLYAQFAKGSLNGYDYTDITGNSDSTPAVYGGASGLTGRDVSAFLLQDAIWYLNDQGGFDGSFNLSAAQIAANPFLQDIIAQYGSLAAAESAADGAFGVGELEVFKNANGTDPLQPFLYIPDGGATAILLSLALGGFGLISRKFRGKF